MSHKTDWFHKAGYGVFVHYLSGLQNDRERVHSLDRETPWDECVREFDTERFAEAMSEAGAGYVIFTVMQIQRFMIAPNATFDRITGYAPGEACATRDLIEDLHRSLSRRGIPLMLYWTGDGPRPGPKAAPAFGWKTPVTGEFVRKWASVARECGERYGDKVAGWWVDGHDGSPFEAVFQPSEARYVGICALEPDGPDQKGGQMSIAELEVYE